MKLVEITSLEERRINVVVVLISGKAESGKSETSKITRSILDEIHWVNGHEICSVSMSYGDYVKDTAKRLLGWDGKKDEAGRKLLQWWGTDFVRIDHPDFWADTVVRLANVIKDRFDYLFIDDARFPNEIDIWKKEGFKSVSVRVERPGHQNILTPEQRLHVSETSLDDWKFDIILSATTTQELSEEIRTKLIPPLINDFVDFNYEQIAFDITGYFEKERKNDDSQS